MSVRQKVPPMRAVDRNVRELPIVDGGVYDVYSWSEGDAGAGVPPCQVHLVVPVAHGVKVALRMKSARALDELVAVLLAHRKDVWGREGVAGDVAPGLVIANVERLKCPDCGLSFSKSCTCTHNCGGPGAHHMTWARGCPSHPFGLDPLGLG